jgi:zona occludens toxin
MSIILITGVPGSGKSLYALPFVKRLSEDVPKGQAPRQVYYSGINGLNTDVLPWLDLEAGVVLDSDRDRSLDAARMLEAQEQGKTYKPWFSGDYPTQAKGAVDWWKLPVGAVIFIDECQSLFRPRGSGAIVPEFVARLEMHRHRGLDIVLVTQHPMLVDQNVRRLVDRHFHVMRNFGLPKATVHEFPTGVRTNPDQNRKDSLRHDFLYPREVYGWYKSSELHTHKIRLPWKLAAIPLLGLIAAVCFYFAYRVVFVKKLGAAAPTASASAPAAGTPGGRPSAAASAPLSYLDARKPRVPGLAYTAPAYDKVTEPVTAPYPAACVVIRGHCRCYSQQGTRLDVGNDLCRGIVDGGFFVDWANPGQPVAAQSDAVASQAQADDGPHTLGIPKTVAQSAASS